MGATKKRRQSKHRGNAAGMIETRGRSGGREAAPGKSSGAAGPRVPSEPSWQRSATKALIPVAILLPFLLFTQKDASVLGIAMLCVLAYLLYVPLAFYTDRWVYNRYVKRR